MNILFDALARVQARAGFRSGVMGLGLVVGLSACSATQEMNPQGEPDGAWKAFTMGKAELPCGVSCAMRYGFNRPELKKLFDNEGWQPLAERVLYVGAKGDQAWFYLGRAAEGLGFSQAAMSYYNQAKKDSYKCGGFPNVCDGFVFPRDIDNRIAIIEQEKVAAAEHQRTTGEKRTRRTTAGKAEVVGATAPPRKSSTAQTKKPERTKQVTKAEGSVGAPPEVPTEKAPVGSLIDM